MKNLSPEFSRIYNACLGYASHLDFNYGPEPCSAWPERQKSLHYLFLQTVPNKIDSASIVYKLPDTHAKQQALRELQEVLVILYFPSLEEYVAREIRGKVVALFHELANEIEEMATFGTGG